MGQWCHVTLLHTTWALGCRPDSKVLLGPDLIRAASNAAPNTYAADCRSKRSSASSILPSTQTGVVCQIWHAARMLHVQGLIGF